MPVPPLVAQEVMSDDLMARLDEGLADLFEEDVRIWTYKECDEANCVVVATAEGGALEDPFDWARTFRPEMPLVLALGGSPGTTLAFGDGTMAGDAIHEELLDRALAADPLRDPDDVIDRFEEASANAEPLVFEARRHRNAREWE